MHHARGGSGDWCGCGCWGSVATVAEAPRARLAGQPLRCDEVVEVACDHVHVHPVPPHLRARKLPLRFVAQCGRTYKLLRSSNCCSCRLRVPSAVRVQPGGIGTPHNVPLGPPGCACAVLACLHCGADAALLHCVLDVLAAFEQLWHDEWLRQFDVCQFVRWLAVFRTGDAAGEPGTDFPP